MEGIDYYRAICLFNEGTERGARRLSKRVFRAYRYTHTHTHTQRGGGESNLGRYRYNVAARLAPHDEA